MIDFLLLLALAAFKFLTLAVLPYFIFWKWFPEKFKRYKIQIPERQKPQIATELKYSLFILLFQALLFWSIKVGVEQKVFDIYQGFGTRGWWSEILAFVGYFVIYDAYFYWTHRLFHHGWLYKKVHVVHHKSLNPTPLAIYSFHPLEAVVGLLYFYPVLYFFPMSLETFIVLVILTDLGNLAGHLGYEFLPKALVNGPFGAWITTPTHHNMHHQYSKSNYGLYWNGWDKLFKTMHARTNEEFNRVKAQ